MRRGSQSRVRLWLAWLAFAALVGCSSERFQLSNRGDTNYSRDLAAANVRVPVDGGPPVQVPSTPVLGQPIVPAVPGAPMETFAATVPAQPSPVPVRPPDVAPGSQPLLAETPRPGPVGTRLDMLTSGPELAGRVVTPVGQPSPRTPIQVLDPRSGEQVVAEVATDDQGMFRVRNLTPGLPYRLVAASRSADGRLVGSLMATPPDGAVVVQLQLENLISGRSPLGNRLSSNPTEEGIAFAGAAQPIPATSPATVLPGSVTVATAQAVTGSPASTGSAATGLARVLPPAASGPSTASAGVPAASNEGTSAGLAAIASDADGRSLQNIQWDPPGSSGKKNAEAVTASPAVSKEPNLSLPREGDLSLPGGELVSKSDVTPAPAASMVAFAGTGLEFAKVYDLEGNKRPVGALAGDFILLDFFGSWCGPCRKAVPHLNDLQSRFSGRGVRIVGVACEYGDVATAIRTANEARVELGIRYPIVVSPMEESSELREHFKVDRYPTVVLVDRAGRVLFQGQGGDPATFQRLEQAIEQALAGMKIASR